jgi:O-antigen biosynthesis protein
MGALRSAASRTFRKVAPQLARRLRPHVTYSQDYVSLARRHVPLSHPLFQLTQADLAASARSAAPAPGPPGSVVWLVPHFWHAAFGGIYTIFRFASGFAERGARTHIVIFDTADADVAALKEKMVASFPSLAGATVQAFDVESGSTDTLPSTDVAICTLWPSAYVLLKFNRVGRKYYFVQDYEPLFYPAGPNYALAESTYRFGFTGIVNTPGLLAALEQRHGMEGLAFVPAVDSRYVEPDDRDVASGRVRIFFYARPTNERNAFPLCVAIIEQLLDRYGPRIEILTAGSVWDEAEYGLAGRVTNLGLLDGLDAVSALYRTCDIGVVYMLSKHPSYQPLEFMASGMATVTNRNEDNLWLLRDGENCLLAEPSPAAMTEQVGRLVDDPSLRARIQRGGAATISRDWEAEVQRVWEYLSADQPAGA